MSRIKTYVYAGGPPALATSVVTMTCMIYDLYYSPRSLILNFCTVFMRTVSFRSISSGGLGRQSLASPNNLCWLIKAPTGQIINCFPLFQKIVVS